MKCITRFLLFIMLVLLISADFQVNPGDKRAFFNAPFNLGEVDRVERRLVHFQDTIPNDTIYICFSALDLPLAFYREIQSGVCLDGICLPVHLYLYWTISGNYLGYTLGEREVLTKNEHELFEAEDYGRLHELLNDPQSLLANYSLEEITSEEPVDQVDGLSGATLLDIRGYIIEGAAYTTHTLWHIVYGTVRDSLWHLSSDYVSEPLVSKMISSKNRQDKQWALDQFKQNATDFRSLLPKIQKIILTGDFVTKERAIRSLALSALDKETVQLELLAAFPEADLATKRMIITELENYGTLSTKVAEKVIILLPDEGNVIVNLLFSMLKDIGPPEPFLLRQIVPLLKHKKVFISEAAHVYLSSASAEEPWLKDILEENQKGQK